MLDPEVRRELRGLTRETADLVARHLVAAGQQIDDDPDRAWRHAQAARSLAARVGVVREAAGLAAYAAGVYGEALAELRAARRMTGSAEHLPVLADCERALGRPEKALELAKDPALAALDEAARIEMLIVASGARRDLGQPEAAMVALQGGHLAANGVEPWTARLWYAYADALLAAGRTDQAREWFLAVSSIDDFGETDADERLVLLDKSARSEQVESLPEH